jgi:Holliday junction resolvasome RuvABC endonuclease subunit
MSTTPTRERIGEILALLEPAIAAVDDAANVYDKHDARERLRPLAEDFAEELVAVAKAHLKPLYTAPHAGLVRDHRHAMTIPLVCLGLDLSKQRPGACIIHPGGWKATSTDPLKEWAMRAAWRANDKTQPGAALAGIQEWVHELVLSSWKNRENADILAVIEEVFIHPKNPRTGIVLGQVHGVAMAELAARGIYFIVVPAPVARRAVLGFSPEGADVKAQIKRAPALKGLEFKDSDATDAYVLARYGMDLLKSYGLEGVKRMYAKVKTPPKKRKRAVKR